MAQLKHVRIHGFRNVLDREIDLTQGDCLIRGKNMSGKTNTLNAIHWAFTGLTLDGSNDNRANFTIGTDTNISVTLDFGDFTFERVCEMVDGTPTINIYVDGTKATTIKNGEARLHAKLGLTDIILTQPKGFNIVRFLLNPVYFDTVAAKDLRKFFYSLSGIDFDAIAEDQSKTVKAILEQYGIHEPYALTDAIAANKKEAKKVIDTCKNAKRYFPSITKDAEDLEKIQTRNLKAIESEEALASKYALNISKQVNSYYQKAMGISVCILEKGVGDDVFKDVCYPILPKSKLPFAVGSYAERSYVGMLFIREVCNKFNIKPLPILLDNVESLDNFTFGTVNSLNVQYIGALVE